MPLWSRMKNIRYQHFAALHRSYLMEDEAEWLLCWKGAGLWSTCIGYRHSCTEQTVTVRPGGNETEHWKDRCVTHLQKHRQCMLQVSDNTLHHVEKYQYLRVVFTSDGRRNKEIDTRICKASAVLRELCRCGDKTGAFKHREAVSFYIGLCSDPHLLSWIVGSDWNSWESAMADALYHLFS